MGDQQRGFAPGLVVQQLLYPVFGVPVQLPERLVHIKDVAAVGQGPCDGKPSLHTARERGRRLVLRVRKPHFFKKMQGLFPVRRNAQHVIEGAQLRYEAVFLKYERRPQPFGSGNGTRVRRFQPGDHAQQGGFAHARGAREHGAGPFGEGEREAFKYGLVAVSFREFLYFHNFEIRETKSALGGTRRHVQDKNGERYELREVFDAFMRFGGMPGIADVGLDQEKAWPLLDGIYSTVVIRDILEREKRRGQKRITDAALLRKIILFLADNIGSNVSIASIGNTLVNEGLLADGRRKGAPSAHTVQAYVNALLESYFFYEIKRFDIKGKEYLRTLGKYYIVDIGLRNYLLGLGFLAG